MSKVRLYGSTSGYTEIIAPAVSSNTTVTLPASGTIAKTTDLGLTQIVPASISVGSGSGSVDSNGVVTFSGSSTVTINTCFSSTYQNYLITCNWTQNNSNQLYFRLRSGSTDSSSAYYYYSGFTTISNSSTVSGMNSDANTVFRIGYATGSDVIGGACEVMVFAPFNSSRRTMYRSNYAWYDNTRFNNGWVSGGHNQVSSYDGFVIFCDGASPLITGDVRIYGLRS